MGQKLGLLRFFAILLGGKGRFFKESPGLGGINDRTVDPVVAGSSPVALARRVPGSVRTGRLTLRGPVVTRLLT